MAASKPILGVLESGSEVRCLIEDTHGGLCCEPGEYDKVEKNMLFNYIKKRNGFDVNVLIVGDSIAENGQGEKGWCTLLQNNLRKTYNNKVSFTNVSMGGNPSNRATF